MKNKDKTNNEIIYYTIGESYGGQQDWFSDLWMYKGGCAAITACEMSIYMAMFKGKTSLYPYDIDLVSKEDFIKFGMLMKPYLKPRISGIKTLQTYIDGFKKYLCSAGQDQISLIGLDGGESIEKAKISIKLSIDNGIPIPYLLLLHKKKIFKDFNWHWFLLTGYQEYDGDFKVKVVTYGKYFWFSLKELWNTGYSEKGGMIFLSL